MSQTRNQPSRSDRARWSRRRRRRRRAAPGNRRRRRRRRRRPRRTASRGRKSRSCRRPWRRRRCRPWRRLETRRRPRAVSPLDNSRGGTRGVVRGSPGDGGRGSRLASRRGGSGPRPRVRGDGRRDGRYSGTAATSSDVPVRGGRGGGEGDVRRGDEDGDVSGAVRAVRRGGSATQRGGRARRR